MKHRKLFILAAFLLVTITFTGCGDGVSKADLQSQVDTYLDKIAELQEQVDGLTKVNEELGGSDQVDRTVYRLSDGTPEYYNSVAGKVLFDNVLTYEGGSQVANTSFISLASKFEMAPSSNWIVKLDGNTTQFNHPSGITGYVNICTTEEIVKPEDLKASTVDTYVTNMGGTLLASNQLFLDDVLAGWYNEFSVNVNVPTKADDGTDKREQKTMLVKAGSFTQSNNIISFTFMYNDDSASSELVSNLLATTKFNNRQLKFQ